MILKKCCNNNYTVASVTTLHSPSLSYPAQKNLLFVWTFQDQVMSAASSAFYSQTFTQGASGTRLFSLSSKDTTSRPSPMLLVSLLDSYSCTAEPLLELAAPLKGDKLLLELAANLATSSCDSRYAPYSTYYSCIMLYAGRALLFPFLCQHIRCLPIGEDMQLAICKWSCRHYRWAENPQFGDPLPRLLLHSHALVISIFDGASQICEYSMAKGLQRIHCKMVRGDTPILTIYNGLYVKSIQCDCIYQFNVFCTIL